MGENKEITEKFLVILGNVAITESPSTFYKAREEGFYTSFTDILGEAMARMHPDSGTLNLLGIETNTSKASYYQRNTRNKRKKRRRRKCGMRRKRT